MRMDAYVMPTNDTDYSCHSLAWSDHFFLEKSNLAMQDYKSHRTYLTNRMGSISRHITPLVINSLGGGHTRKHTCIQKFAGRSNFKKPGARRPQYPWFKKGIGVESQITMQTS